MFGLHLLPALMARFQQRYPEVVFDVMLSDRNVDIVEEGRDVAVMLSDWAWARTRWRGRWSRRRS